MSADDTGIQTEAHVDSISLPAPRTTGGRSLREALALRRSSREFGTRPLSSQVLSDLLWCAFGINRPDGGGRTAPSAKNWQEIEIYLVTAAGVSVYEPSQNRLRRMIEQDVRAQTGMQDFVAAAPVNLVYVADLDKVDAPDAEQRRFYCAADAGFIAQNVYLFCASEGLATVVRGLVDRRRLAPLLRLRRRQRVVLAQTVGYPAPG